ncbi:MAG: hypothetical protein Hals2KO_00400 [Halioglobus sp.]
MAQICAAQGYGVTSTVDVLLHSPWQRTTQSATIIQRSFPDAQVVSNDALRPGATTTDVDELLQTLLAGESPPQHLMLVSHQPLVSRLVDHYLNDLGRVPALSPGGFATLQLEVPATGCASLCCWALPPDYEPGR